MRALLEQLDAVLPHLPDPDRHRPVAALLTRACLLAGAQALDEGDPDSASARFSRAAELARATTSPDLAVEAAIGHADALLDVGASGDALAVLEHAGVDVAHHHPGSRWSSPRIGPTPRRPTRSSTWPTPWSARDRRASKPRCTPSSPTPSRPPAAATRPRTRMRRQARTLATRIGSRRVLRRLDGQGLSAGSAVSSSASAAR